MWTDAGVDSETSPAGHHYSGPALRCCSSNCDLDSYRSHRRPSESPLKRFGTAREFYEQSLQLKRELGDRAGEARTLNNLGIIARKRGNFDRATDVLQQSLTIKRDLGDRHGEAMSLNSLGLVAEREGDLETARHRYEQTLEMFRETGDRHSEAASLGNPGLVARQQGDSERAREYHRESLALFRDVGSQNSIGEALGFLGAAELPLEDGQDGRVKLANAISTLREIDATPAILDVLRQHIATERTLGHEDRVSEFCERAAAVLDQADDALEYERAKIAGLCDGIGKND